MKRWVIGIAVALLALAVLTVAALFTLSRYALPWLSSQITQKTGYQVQARSMDFHFRRGIVLEDVQVLSPEKKEVAAAKRFYIRPNWGELIRRHQWVIDEISIDLADGQVLGRGQVSKDLDANVQIEYRATKARASAPPSGVLSARLVKGQGQIIAHLSRGALQMSATAQVDVPNKKIEAWLRTGRYVWDTSQPKPWDIEDLSVHLKGNLSRWNVSLFSHLRDQATLRYRGTVEKLEEGWRVDWDTIALHIHPDTDWHTSSAGYATWHDTEGVKIPDLRLSDGNGRVHLEAVALGRPTQDFSLKAVNVSVGPLLDWMSPGRGITGRLDGTVHLQGPASSPRGPVEVVLSSGQVRGAAFDHIQARLRLEPPWILIDHMDMAVPQTDKNVTGSGKVPWHLVQAESPNLPMELHFRAADSDPRMLGSFVPGLDIDSGGHLGIIVAVRGLYPNVTVEGTATLKVPGLRYPDAGLDMKDIDLELQSRGKRAEVTRGQAKLGKGTLHLSGKVDWPALDLTLKAEKATFTVPKKLNLKTDGDIHLGGTLVAPELTGEVRPKEGTYTEPKKEKKPATPAPASEPSQTWIALRIDIRTVWEHGLWYRDGLTKIETAADLHIRKTRGSPDVTLIGPLTLLRGSYDAYGKDFRIDTGNITFTGTPDINPILSIQADYRTQDYLINLSVSGNLKPAPKLTFTSSPPLSEQEILSVLVTGKAGNSFGGNDQRSDDQAKQAAADVASSYLTRSLRENGLNLGMDVVRVTPTAAGTVWTVGRYMGPDLFVSYGQNPKDAASSVVNADYSLSRRWSLATQASSTSDTFVDLIFRYPLKLKSSKNKK